MFCNKCGKKINDDSAFCTWCGAQLDSLEPSEAPVMQPAGAPAEEESSAANSREQEFTAQEAAAAQEQSYTAAEQPEDIPAPTEAAKSVWSAEVPLTENTAKEEKPVKYYTGAHLAMCLIAAGVMAMAAGVFAALYFSAIL